MERKEPKVVAIDDNPDNLVAVKAFVTDAFPGARVFTALNGEKGIDLVREHDPDVILLDIVMPGMDGFEVCRLIKQDPRVRHIPVVFLTALRGDRKSRIKALEVGGEAFISKPFEEAEFIAQVRAMVKIKEANERERDEKRYLASLVKERTAQLEKELAERKATEVALSKSEGRYRAIYDQSPIGIELYDSTGALIHVNPACLNLLGVDNMEVLLGLSLFADPNLNDEYKAKLRQRETIRFQGPFDFDKVKTLNLYPTRREGIIWLDVLITPLGDTAEPVTGYLVQIQDVSVRKGVEDALRDSEERYRAIADFTYDWEYWRAPDGKFIYNSPSCERITGYSPEEFDLDPNLLITITHPDDRDIVIDHLSLGMSSSREHGILEFRIINRNGEEQWIGHECQPIYNTNGEYLGHRGSNRDITQRKRADDALRESEERYHALFSHNTSVSLLIDPETGRIVDANPAACNYYGYSHEQLIRRGIYDLNRKEREKVIKNLLYARSGGSKHFSTTHYLANGEERNVEIYSGPITIEGKSLFYSIIHDITDRRRAEEELEETRHFIEHIIAVTPTLIYIFDIAEQRNIYTNRGIFEALGYTSENIAAMGRSLFASILHPDDGERVAHHHALFSTLKEGTVAEIEYRMQHADGHWCWLHSWDVAFFLNPDGSVKQVLGVAIDITDQKVSEEALRESEKKYRQLVDLAQEGIWAIDADGMTTYVNPRIAEMLGYTGEEMQGAHLFSFMDDAGKAIAAEAMERRRQGIKEVHVFEFITKGGDRIYTALSTGPITDEKGTYSGALAVVSDITDRKRAEEELARKHEELNAAYEQLAASEEELRANYEELATSQRSLRETTNYLNNLFDFANAPIITWDPEYVITRFNHAFEQLTGLKQEDVIEKPLDILFPPQSRATSLELIKKTMSGERWETVDIPIFHVNGSIRTVLWNSATLLAEDQTTVVATIAQGQDITERKRVEDALLRVNEKLNVLSQLTRKDLTSQTFVLSSYLELAKNQLTGQDRIIETLQKGDQAIRQIRETIEYSKDYQDMGAKPSTWQKVKMAMLFGLSHISIGNIQHSIETENLEIFADPLLEKVCQRLFENSVKHGDHVIRIRVWHTVTPEGATIFFEDDGIGIPHEKKEQIFLRGDGTRASMRSLIFVRDILDITGITIHETGEPGKGARFEIFVLKGCYRMKQEDTV
jgi:PAS domain S-box-containing protein